MSTLLLFTEYTGLFVCGVIMHWLKIIVRCQKYIVVCAFKKVFDCGL